MKNVVIERLHAALVQALRARGPGALEHPVTVAEIYQDLIPYRTVRGLAGVELNADYEHALLRLLAGEGGYARLEPEGARQELELELELPNPNVGLYRKFAACDVWVSEPAAPEQTPEVAAAATPMPLPEHMRYAPAPPVFSTLSSPSTPVDRATGAREAGSGAAVASPLESAGRDDTGVGATATAADACPFCAAALPTGRTIRFCPYCGVDQRSRPCPSCGEVLEQDWRYCIGCGSSAEAATHGAPG
mgnify:FL=1